MLVCLTPKLTMLIIIAIKFNIDCRLYARHCSIGESSWTLRGRYCFIGTKRLSVTGPRVMELATSSLLRVTHWLNNKVSLKDFYLVQSHYWCLKSSSNCLSERMSGWYFQGWVNYNFLFHLWNICLPWVYTHWSEVYLFGQYKESLLLIYNWIWSGASLFFSFFFFSGWLTDVSSHKWI